MSHVPEAFRWPQFRRGSPKTTDASEARTLKMHSPSVTPQLVLLQREFGNRWVVFSFLALLSLFVCSCGKTSKAKADGSSGPEKALPVTIAAVASREVRRPVESVGSLYAYDEVAVSAEVEGRAEKVYVDVGDHVTEGQVLVQILPIEYELAVAQQQALLDEARAKLGLPDTEFDLVDLTRAASVKKAAADLANAEQKYRRTKDLVESGVLSRQNYDQDEANYNAAKATYDLAIQDVKNLQAAIKQQQATTELAKKKLRDTSIRAPFDGFIKERAVTVGQYLKTQMTAIPVFTIVNVDPMRVRLKVPEMMATWVPVGQPLTLTVEALPDRTFSGKIWRINPSDDPQTRTFDVEALVENHQRLLKPGFFAKASITSTKIEKVLFIPRRSVTYAYGIYKAYVVKGNKLKEIEVKVGDQSGDDIEVLEGVQEGDHLAVAAEGQELALKDGLAIKPAK
jgi:RND family efflux transporter MFP subunit